MSTESSTAGLLQAVVGFVTGVAATVAAYAAGSLVLFAFGGGLYGGALLAMPVVAVVLAGFNAARSRRLQARRVAGEFVLGVGAATVLGYALVELLYAARGGV